MLWVFLLAGISPAEPSVRITRERGGVVVETRTLTLNHLGQATEDHLEGTGVAERNLSPAFRDDGSLASVSLTVGGATASASFNANGTLSGFTHPALGPLRVSHGFANGSETLTVHGTTATRALDDSASSLTGAGVMDRSRATTISGGQWFEDKITPATGATTSMFANPSWAKELHDYAAGPDRGMSWLAGGLPHSVSLGRGGATVMAYSNDGARDLLSITWPTVSSAGFPEQPFYGGAVGFPERDAAGNITQVDDPSGSRSLDYEKNRLTVTDWLSGELNPFQVERHHDDQGRLQSILVRRNGVVMHTVVPAYNDVSGEILGISDDEDTPAFTAVVTRDETNRHVTGFTRGPVTQRWVRGTTGRITTADTNNTVNGAPWFNYTGFDNHGRRTTVGTSKGTWAYDYHSDGQLDSAENSTLGFNVSYSFDGIGRRNFGNNQQDALNRFLAIQHPHAAKKLFLSADPAARLFAAQGAGALTELTPFDGWQTYEVNHPGASGGWVPWHVRGVLEDGGDPGAHPDAVAQFSGHLWFPPTAETFTFDDDGNREGSSLWDYGWDGRNKLVRARTKTWNTAPEGWELEFDYDAEGRRFKKTVTRYAEGEAVDHKVIYFVWDGWDLLFERHEDGNGNPLLERRYVWGPDIADGAAGGAGGLLLIRETRGQTTHDYFPLYDGTGHVTGLTNSAGNLVAEYWWGPFGELIEAKGEMAQANPWRYATKYHDAETGLYYFGHRYYDPITGQWLNREPLGEDESLNLYANAGNDPVNNVDVQGLASVAINGNVTSSLELLSATLAKLGKPETSRILDEALGKNADWVAYRQAVGMGGNFGQYIVGILTAHEGTPVRDLGLETRLRMWAMTASPSQLTAAADSGNFDTRLSRMLHDQSQAASNAAHDWRILSGTVQGATFIAQPETVLFKGAAAGILAIKGLSMTDDALRLGIRAEGGGGKTFYSVLSDADYLRFKGGGTPWPTGLAKSNIGEGAYLWGSHDDATRYLKKIRRFDNYDSSLGTSIRRFSIDDVSYSNLRTLDLRRVDESTFQRFIDTHTLYGEGLPHGFQHIIFPRNIGTEYFFDKDVFNLLKFD